MLGVVINESVPCTGKRGLPVPVVPVVPQSCPPPLPAGPQLTTSQDGHTGEVDEDRHRQHGQM